MSGWSKTARAPAMTEPDDHREVLGEKRRALLDRTDSLPPKLRECVHEFGLPIVTACMSHGVNDPAAIRSLVKEIWAGARQAGQKSGARNTLDWLLLRNGAGISAKTLCRTLEDNHLVIASVEPTKAMLEASMAAVSGGNVICTKEEKHRRRLRAALRAAMVTDRP